MSGRERPIMTEKNIENEENKTRVTFIAQYRNALFSFAAFMLAIIGLAVFIVLQQQRRFYDTFYFILYLALFAVFALIFLMLFIRFLYKVTISEGTITLTLFGRVIRQISSEDINHIIYSHAALKIGGCLIIDDKLCDEQNYGSRFNGENHYIKMDCTKERVEAIRNLLGKEINYLNDKYK